MFVLLFCFVFHLYCFQFCLALSFFMTAKSIFKNPLQFLGLEETQKKPDEKEHSGGRPSGASATSSSSGVFRVPPPPENILDPVPPDACIRDIPTVHEVDTNSSSDSDETSSTDP